VDPRPERSDGRAAAGQAVDAPPGVLGELEESRLDRDVALMDRDALAGGDWPGLLEDLEIGFDSPLRPRGATRQGEREQGESQSGTQR
jgi:hypothetical protein